MPEPNELAAPKHWLIAAWPGMANVAVLAAGYLIQKLGLKPIGQLPPRGHFDIQAVDVKEGLIAKPTLPRSLFYSGEIPGGRLTVLVGEAQPSSGAYAFANELLDKAKEIGVDRVVTFASMATQLHPTEDPAVFGAATQPVLMDSLVKLEVKVLAEGQIGGLNGVLLGAAAERGMPGLCLLGEIPFFAVQIPNPKATKAVLDAFSLLSGVTIDLEELGEHAAKIDQVLLQMLERMQSAHGEGEGAGAGDDEAKFEKPQSGPPSGPKKPALDLATREKIERLFESARKDRAKGVSLKQELDRMGVFSQYEDRFLDLFRRAE